MTVAHIHTAASIRQEGNTYRALLQDTRDLLAMLKYATPKDEQAAQVQIEAIDELLTDDAASG
jgi:hypothetical protein